MQPTGLLFHDKLITMFTSKNLRKVDLIFLASIAVFFLLIFLIVRSEQEVGEARQLQERTYKIIAKIEALLLHTIDVETGTRGYAISGNETYLEPFESGKVASLATLDSLKQLVIDSEQQGRLDTLQLLIKRRIAIAENIISMRTNEGMDYTVKYISQGEGKAVMDSIRKVASRASNRQLFLLSQRSAQTDAKRSALELYVIILLVIAFAVLLVAYFTIRQSLNHLLVGKEIQEGLIDELSYQNKQLDDFAHITSHNIRGPAKNISALVSMVNKDTPVSEYQLIFSKIGNVSQNLTNTLNELLDILHVKKNKAVERTKISFQEMFFKEKENLEAEIARAKADIYFDFSSAPSIEYPKQYMESIFHNLMTNALKYRASDRTPAVQFRTEQKEGQTYLHVSDNGLGIDLNRFGDKVFGLHKTFHDHPEARGIGLFMTKAQIEPLGGKISVESKVGKGTTFTVRF